MKDWSKPHLTAVQPFTRTTDFFALRDIRMKEVLENHQKMLIKHKEIFNIEFLYCMGMSNAEYVQMIDFMPEDTQLFHEFMNDLKKINAPFMDFEEAVIGVSEVKHYPSVWGVKDLEKEVAPEIRNKFERRGNVWVTAPEITLSDMLKEQDYLRKKGYENPVWEYPIDKYGWEAFRETVKPKKRRFGDWPRMVSLQYASHTPQWWALPDHERGQIVLKHKTLLKKYIKQIDRRTVYLSGMSDTEFITIFEYPFENIRTFHQMFYDQMRLDAPYINIEKSVTGIAGIKDYWLEQLEDIDIKESSMEEIYTDHEIGSSGELPQEAPQKRTSGRKRRAEG